MPEFQRHIDFINKEIDESYMNLERQHTQIKWFVQLYMASLFGYFSLSGYLLKQPPTVLSNSIGLGAGISVFFLGWLLLSILGHKTAMMVLIHKHISVFRGHRLKMIDNDKYSKDYVFPRKPNTVFIASMTGVTPYVFFFINYIILGGTAYVYFYRLSSDLHLALVSTIFVTAFAGLFYPRSCVVYNKHIRTATDARTLEEKHRLEECFENARKEYPWCNKTCTIILIILLLIILGCLILIKWPFFPISQNWILLISIVMALIFAIVRYAMETYKALNVLLCLRIVKHK